MTESTQFAPEWLALRETADAAARAADLLEPLRAVLPAGGLVIRDLGCGTGSMGRWLVPRLPRAQHWILTDRDPMLLARAAAGLPHPATAVPDQRDITRLSAADLAGTSLVTGSALLDLLTAEEVAGLAAACVEARCPALLALSVVGVVELSPVDPLDAELAAAFNAHQRRTVDGRRLLGPDAAAAAAAAFAGLGAVVHRRPSPWRLGPHRAALTAQWLQGWVAAAVAQDPALARDGFAYLRRRLDAANLRAVIHHEDLLALPV
ncbi:MAG: SAM-dependent methyltransferase [Actinophytocola sp.]|uniref:class I SAM-dependent methyltransferase n=1 Tax=Actinophytocola sp. TaxID=1872138 RepID=UPI00132BA8D4|nr:class I SAM-dependent methyltransferase [Actinophytocola sp.]MPZ82097.1 SAM-dependent methyltransferase [Actinophytocola sp.]